MPVPAPADVPAADEMPMLGLGTWENDDHDQCVESVRTALEMGYRHIDTAQAYRNEDAVGEAISAADVPREDIFLATKVWITRLSQDDVVQYTEDSLDRLGTEYVDLLYVHWPAGEYDPEGTLSAFDQLYDEGKICRVGLSNFEPHHLDEAETRLDAPIFANQVEMHPYLPQANLRTHCEDSDIELVAYSPLARGDVLDDSVLSEIASAHDASAAQVSLAWLREKGVTAIPKATSEAHIRDNFRSVDVDLTDEEIARIDDIDATRRKVQPDFAPAAWE